jgi:hypothetical protein
MKGFENRPVMEYRMHVGVAQTIELCMVMSLLKAKAWEGDVTMAEHFELRKLGKARYVMEQIDALLAQKNG